MQIHNLKIKYPKKRRKTVGRGGKKGTYSGRGNKGQKARSGFSLDPLFEGGRSSLIDRLKKVRGFKALKPKTIVLKLADLDKKLKTDDIINKESLIKVGLLNKKDSKKIVKILSPGPVKNKYKLSNEVRASSSAKKALEKTGGEWESNKKK